MAKSKTAVAKKDENLPTTEAMQGMFEADAGQGMENITREDTKIPFLRILQPLSPQLQEGDPQYIEGAKAGMLMNTVTRDVYDGKEGLMVIPVHFEKVYIEWQPRTSGGGFVAEYDNRETAEADKQEGNDITDTANHYLLMRDQEGIWQPVVLSCKSTMLGVSRSWNAMMQSVKLKGPNGPFTPPSFACIYNLSTARQQNDKGTWHNIVVERVSIVEEPALYSMAKDFREMLLEGRAAAGYGEEDEGKPSTGTDVTEDGEELPNF